MGYSRTGRRKTCIDCGSREHVRCYMSKPGPRIHIHAGKPVNKTGDTVVDMAVIYKITQLTDAVLTLEQENRSLKQMLMRHIYDNHPEEDHCHCIWECECNK